MGNVKEEIKNTRNKVLKLIEALDKSYTNLINALFDANLRREAQEAEEARKRIGGVKEAVLRRKFKGKDNLIVLRTLLVELQWVESQLNNLKPMLQNFDGSDAVLNKIKDTLLSTDIIIESAKMGSKKDLMRLFKKRNLSGMNSFYSLIKWNNLERGLPEVFKDDSKIMDATPEKYRKQRKDREKIRFFAFWKSDIARSAVDFFSIGHILMGQIFFFIVYLLVWTEPVAIYDAPFAGALGPNYDKWCVIIAIIVGIAWEPIENIILWKMGMKFESRRDSFLNIVFDILFVSLGAIIAYTYDGFYLHLGLIVGEMIAFFIIRWYFLNKR